MFHKEVTSKYATMLRERVRRVSVKYSSPNCCWEENMQVPGSPLISTGNLNL